MHARALMVVPALGVLQQLGETGSAMVTTASIFFTAPMTQIHASPPEAR